MLDVVRDPESLLPGGQVRSGGQASVKLAPTRSRIERTELVRVEYDLSIAAIPAVLRFDPVPYDPPYQFLFVRKLGFGVDGPREPEGRVRDYWRRRRSYGRGLSGRTVNGL